MIKFRYFWVVGCLALLTANTSTAEVVFNGLDSYQEANARLLMPLASAECTSAQWRVERLFRDSERNLRRALEALGYYDVEVAKTLQFDPDCWRATLNITVGEPTLLRKVDIDILGEAANDVDFQSLVEVGKPIAGTRLNHQEYERYKSSLLKASIDRGYFDAELQQSEVVVDSVEHAADVEMKLDSGTRYRFGELTFTEGILRDDLMRGFSDVRTGEFYDARQVSELYRDLNGSTYFSSVRINSEPLDKEKHTIPVNVVLEPGTRRIYSIGAGLTTDTGPHGRLGYTNRRRNARGHIFESKLFGSPVKSELTASYRWPRGDPRREWFNAVFGIQHENTDSSESDIYKVGIQRSQNLGSSWLETRYADYSFENFKVGDQDTSSNLVILGVNWERAKGQELSRVDNGLRMSFDLRGAGEALASDTSFLQFRFKTKWVHSISDRFRILARAGVGITEQKELTELPVSVRLFAGGDQSVRGYDFETLGPLDADGLVIGGSNLLEGSVEFDYLFKPQWAVAAFVDSGSAFNNTAVNFSTGVGLGIRWYSPVGPVRLDFAHPLDDPDKKVRVHISLGLDL